MVEWLLDKAGTAGDRGDGAGDRVAAGGLLPERAAGLGRLVPFAAVDGDLETQVL